MFTITSLSPEFLPLLFLALAIVLVINIFLLILFVFAGLAITKRMAVSAKDIEQQKHEQYQKAETLLTQARQESLHIVEEANKKAGELLQKTQVVQEAIEKQLSQEIKEFSQKERERVVQISTKLIEEYRNMIESTKQQYGTAVASTAKEMADVTKQSLKEFEQFLKDQTTRYEATLKEQVQQGFMSAQKEIGDYKRESLRKVEDAIYQILNLVAKSVLGKSLNLEDKQELVLHALNEAKQQAFFEI